MVETPDRTATTPEHSLISWTAKFVVHLRGKTNIPFCKEIATLCDAEAVCREKLGSDFDVLSKRGPYVELRYKAVDAAAAIFPNTQFLELAAGMNPRGMIYANKPGVTYVETDLPGILNEKKRIISGYHNGRIPPNLVLHPLNVVDNVGFLAVDKLFTGHPVTVICEGLLPYLNHIEKATAARSIYRFLMHRGGVWITPDIFTRDRLVRIMGSDPNAERLVTRFMGQTKRDLLANCFKDVDEAVSFFRGCGFKAMRLRQMELVPTLSLPIEDYMLERLMSEEILVLEPLTK